MTLQDTITNLGTAIINLVNMRITKQVAAHCEEIETVLLELKSKIDELVENSGNSSGDNNGEEVLNVNRVDGETIILTKEYLNKYVTEAKFTEDLQVSLSCQGITTYNYEIEDVTFYTNEATYIVDDDDQRNVNATFSPIINSGSCSLYWDTYAKEIDIINSPTIDWGEEGTIGLLLIAGTNTTDRDGTDLGSDAFAIGGQSTIIL